MYNYDVIFINSTCKVLFILLLELRTRIPDIFIFIFSSTLTARQVSFIPFETSFFSNRPPTTPTLCRVYSMPSMIDDVSYLLFAIATGVGTAKFLKRLIVTVLDTSCFIICHYDD